MPDLDRGSSSLPSPLNIQSVARALRLLEIILENLEPLSAAEAAKLAGINRTTAYGILTTLVASGYIYKVEATGKFASTAKTYAISYPYPSRLLMVRYSALPLSELAQTYKAGVRLIAISDRNELITLNRYSIYNDDYLHPGMFYGRTAYHATSMGKLILAYLDPQQRKDIIKEYGLPRYTDATITEESALDAEITQIRESGYAVDTGEFFKDTCSFSFPIYNSKFNRVRALFSLAGCREWKHGLPETFIPDCLQKSRELSLQLGWDPI